MTRRTVVVVGLLAGLGWAAATAVSVPSPNQTGAAPAPKGGLDGRMTELEDQVKKLTARNAELGKDLAAVKTEAELAKAAANNGMQVEYFDLVVEKDGIVFMRRAGMVQLAADGEEWTVHWHNGTFGKKVLAAFPIVQGHTRAVDSIRDLEAVWDGNKAGIKGRYWGHLPNLHAVVRVYVLFHK